MSWGLATRLDVCVLVCVMSACVSVNARLLACVVVVVSECMPEHVRDVWRCEDRSTHGLYSIKPYQLVLLLKQVHFRSAIFVKVLG